MNLRTVRGEYSPFDLADLVAWFPAGCAFWRSVGGPASWSPEERALYGLDFQVRVLDYRMRQSKGEKPKPYPEPEYASQRRAESQKQNRKAAAYLRRQQNQR